MKIVNNQYSIEYSVSEDKIIFKGVLRLQTIDSYNEIMDFIIKCSINSRQKITLDFSNLENINSAGIASLSLFFIKLRETDKKIRIISSTHIPWQKITLKDFQYINKNIEIEDILIH